MSDFTCEVFKDLDSRSSSPTLSSSAAENSSCNIHTEFECGNGECINYQLTCDGIAHCKDKSDEKMQYCGKSIRKRQEKISRFDLEVLWK